MKNFIKKLLGQKTEEEIQEESQIRQYKECRYQDLLTKLDQINEIAKTCSKEELSDINKYRAEIFEKIKFYRKILGIRG